jgi:hypothetical protein
MYIKITAKKWFQRSYGNTYHSVLIEKISGEGADYKAEKIGYIPFRYGYGDHYLNTTADILGISETELRNDIRENRQQYCIFVVNVNRKKDL